MCSKWNPEVSVIMGTRYRRTDTALLQRAVESILNQTYSDFEFLICDDGSTEEAKFFLERVAAVDTRVKLVRRADCLDLARKLNLCISAVKGKYIARMDDDDFSHPDRLEKQIAVLSCTPATAFVGCNVSLVLNGTYVGTRVLPKWPKVEDFYFTQPYIHPALMFRREVFGAVNGYSERQNCEFCEDYDLLLRLYEEGYAGINLQEVLLDYTISGNAKSGRRMRHRFNEAHTRYKRFKALGRFPTALPYVIKPIIVGLLPSKVLTAAKRRYAGGVELNNGDRGSIGK